MHSFRIIHPSTYSVISFMSQINSKLLSIMDVQAFMRSLCVLLVPDAEYRPMFSSSHPKLEPLTFAQKVKFDSGWFGRRMKCYLRHQRFLPHESLRFQQFYGLLFGCCNVEQPLFNGNSWEKAKSFIENVQMAIISDREMTNNWLDHQRLTKKGFVAWLTYILFSESAVFIIASRCSTLQHPTVVRRIVEPEWLMGKNLWCRSITLHTSPNPGRSQI